jgi:plastocyanin
LNGRGIPDRITRLLAAAMIACCAALACAQQSADAAELTGYVIFPAAVKKTHLPAVVVWLSAIGKSPAVKAPAPGRFTLVQKNRMFTPHLLVIPVGSKVSFPNEDPFFHNVFSLFNGKRFDLGLYEAGSTREVEFSREGVSYIFCNIHPEMSAVVISLSTPLFAVADSSAQFAIHSVPAGEYELHVWIEGAPQPALDQLSRRITVREGEPNSISVDASSTYHPVNGHLNMYGKPYDRDTRPPY